MREHDDDALVRAARYRDAQDPAAEFTDEALRVDVGGDGAEQDIRPVIRPSDEVYEVANTAIEQAMARGDFDELKYAGRPIPGLGGTHDPDWWLKGLIEREGISGLGPPAIALRREDADMEATLDALFTERAVREAVEDFNGRIIETRRQLLGGPPVTTPTRDVDAELDAWRRRRAERAAASEAAEAAARAAAEEEKTARRGRWRRWLRGQG
ncbi:DUF1992 domain-containing protein [Zafaria sp. Z1313]|uniref:DnaJ family domain-containing protein n=1 Tax=Zafaria sp. Z1313 TaxID=3423202 RepID=UPI003D30191F